MTTAKKTTSKKKSKPTGKNGRQTPEPQKKAKAPATKKHKKLMHESDKNPYRFVWLSLIFLFISVTIAFAEISYLTNWKHDVSLVSIPLGSEIDEGVRNSCGHIGAIVADLLIRKLFGIGALVIPVFLLVAAISLVNVRKFRISSNILPLAVFTCICSLSLGCFDGRNPEFFGSGLGGEMGIYLSEYLEKYLGKEGTEILLTLLIIAFIWGIAAKYCIIAFSRIFKSIALSAAFVKKKKYQSPAITVRELGLNKSNEEINAAGEEIETNKTENVVVDSAIEFAEASTKIESIKSESDSVSDSLVSEICYEDEYTEHFETVMLDNGRLAAKITEDYFIYFCPELLTPKDSSVTSPADILPEISKENEEDTFIVIQRETSEIDERTYSPIEQEDATSNENLLNSNDSYKITDENRTAGETIQNSSDQITKLSFNENLSSDEEDDLESVIGNSSEQNNGQNEITITSTEEEPPKGNVKIDDLVISKSELEKEVSDADVNQRELYDPTLELRGYKKPTIDLLKKYDESEILVKEEEVVKNKEQIVNTLSTFGINISAIEATVGPTVTLYEIKPAPGVRISKIQNLEKDIALALAALGIRIIAPIPGKGAIGIEVPNKQKATVSMYSVIKSAKFHDSTAELPIALGRTIQNETLVLDLAKMPHLLVAGATGQGKSVGLNAIITSLLYKKHPAELKFVMVDPKRLELTPYAALAKHFMAQMEGSDDIILTDFNKVIYTLNSICKEMDDRYKLLEDAGVKNLKEYNNKFIHRKLNPEKGHRYLPYLVVIVDEFADLIMTAGREIETPIARIAQLARAAGIHMIIATQRPTTNIITGTIKANFPARIAFRVTSYIDSKTILDKAGADQLIGRGDMLVYHGSDLTRVQCAFVDTPEVEAITNFIGSQHGYFEPYQLPEYQPETENNNGGGPIEHQSGPMDPLLIEVARYVVDNQIGSTSKIQRNFEIGFNRAGRIVDQLEKIGVVGKQQGSKPRQVLISDPVLLEHILDNYR